MSEKKVKAGHVITVDNIFIFILHIYIYYTFM